MKKLYKSLGIGALSLSLASPCFADTLIGKPKVVKTIAGEDGRTSWNVCLSIILEVEVDNDDTKKKTEYVIARRIDAKYAEEINDASALVQLEINDGDNQYIKVEGNYDKTVFNIEKLYVEDYVFNFTDSRREPHYVHDLKDRKKDHKK